MTHATRQGPLEFTTLAQMPENKALRGVDHTAAAKDAAQFARSDEERAELSHSAAIAAANKAAGRLAEAEAEADADAFPTDEEK